MKKITATFINPVSGNKEELYIGTAKQIEEFVMVETKDYTRLYLQDEFENFIKERGYKVA